ncbi:hypothetical protein ABT56_05450 [Photobacterium aquae]|uniref:Uncharacterized protein n=1 Tax=Photobacterium aquae TaxID=1195763 RepID=A0A0J1H6Z2_9GAMM|nr:hypothetical protein [Photobacterium aquae]KLV07510.1 hypothetical protein ABT56_05450 [Photobacterium aquae]
MDIERFSPHHTTFSPAVIAPLPTTVELTGFSGSRHYLEQQEPPRHSSRGYDLPPLDNISH